MELSNRSTSLSWTIWYICSAKLSGNNISIGAVCNIRPHTGVTMISCGRGSIVCLLNAHTDLYIAGKGSLHVFMCVYMFIDEYTSVQGGKMDENQTVAGARSLKCFKC